MKKVTGHHIHHTVKTLCDAVIHETTIAENRKTNNKSNLSKEEKQALLDLQERDDIIITNADKGGAVVIQDVKEYIKEGNRQLNNSDFYKRLTKTLPIHIKNWLIIHLTTYKKKTYSQKK